MSISRTDPKSWRKSSYSSARGQDCVEVGEVPDGAAVRDTQNRENGYLVFESAEWSALVGAVRK